MKVIELREDWSPENLTLCERPDPQPTSGQVVVAMKAASINYRDALLVRGGYGSRAGALPLIPLSDGAGEVIAVGEGVEGLAVGDRVVPSFFQSWLSGPASEARFAGSLGGPLDGVMAERMLLPAAGVVPMPDHLSFAEAAAYPCAGVTAWSAIVRHGAIRPGQTVLVQGTGGVALFALQFARLAGAEVIAISSTDEKLERLRELGAAHVINYRTTEKWGRLAAEMAGGDGVDMVVELGGAATFAQSLRAVRTGGTIALIGVLGGAAPELNLPPVVMRDLRLQGVTVGSRDDLAAMFAAVARHRSRPVMDRHFAFGELREALDYLLSGAHVGKVAIDFV